MLIFDFDGVLMDSVGEMMVTAYNSVAGTLVTTLDDLPGNTEAIFRHNRPYIQKGGEAITLMQWALDNADQPVNLQLSSQGYHDLKRKETEPLDALTARFFATRKRFVDLDINRWRNLNAPYQPLMNHLIQAGADRVVILTNKNREAAVNLCHHFGLLVRPENVYSGDNGTTKIENFLQIEARFSLGHYLFVDDSLANLYELDTHFRTSKPTLTLMLATWGYIGTKDRELALEKNFGIVNQQHIIDLLASELL